MLVIFAVHVLVLPVFVWLLLDGQKVNWRGLRPRDEWPGDEPDPEPAPPRTGGPALPLGDAAPAGVRIRSEHERVGESRRRVRRPEHAPEPARPREPAGS